MVVPGLYGYVSATKWLVDIELTTFAAYDAVLGPARLGAAGADQDRVADRHAARFARLRAGRVPVAGVAWAQHRGIEGVEVRVDGGPWQAARLAAAGHDRHLAAVGLPLGRLAGAAHAGRARDRRDGRHPDARARRSRPERRDRRPHDRRRRRLSRYGTLTNFTW